MPDGRGVVLELRAIVVRDGDDDAFKGVADEGGLVHFPDDDLAVSAGGGLQESIVKGHSCAADRLHAPLKSQTDPTTLLARLLYVPLLVSALL